jgi:Zn-dependent protease
MPNFPDLVQKMAVWALPTLFAFTGHAIAMAQLAWHFGDRSPAMRERQSWNPLKHADPVGTVVVPLVLIAIGGFVIGWPKPVPVNPGAFRNPRKDLALLSLGAVGSNLIMAFAWAFLMKLAVLQDVDSGIWLGVQFMSAAGVTINLIFMLFGLLPIPGFAGGHVVGAILPPHLAFRWYAAQNWTMLVLLALMMTGVLGVVLGPPFLAMRSLVFGLVGIEG